MGTSQVLLYRMLMRMMVEMERERERERESCTYITFWFHVSYKEMLL